MRWKIDHRTETCWEKKEHSRHLANRPSHVHTSANDEVGVVVCSVAKLRAEWWRLKNALVDRLSLLFWCFGTVLASPLSSCRPQKTTNMTCCRLEMYFDRCTLLLHKLQSIEEQRGRGRNKKGIKNINKIKKNSQPTGPKKVESPCERQQKVRTKQTSIPWPLSTTAQAFQQLELRVCT